MLSVKAIYKEGKFIPENRPFPEGDNKEVIIVFPDEENDDELHPEWEAEINRRYEQYQKTGDAIDGEKFFDKLEKEVG